MRNIVFRRPDGGLAITHIILDIEPDAHAQELLKDPAYSGFTVLGYDVETPTDREHRDAWDYDAETNRVVVNPDKIGNAPSA